MFETVPWCRRGQHLLGDETRFERDLRACSTATTPETSKINREDGSPPEVKDHRALRVFRRFEQESESGDGLRRRPRTLSKVTTQTYLTLPFSLRKFYRDDIKTRSFVLVGVWWLPEENYSTGRDPKKLLESLSPSLRDLELGFAKLYYSLSRSLQPSFFLKLSAENCTRPP